MKFEISVVYDDYRIGVHLNWKQTHRRIICSKKSDISEFAGHLVCTKKSASVYEKVIHKRWNESK